MADDFRQKVGAARAGNAAEFESLFARSMPQLIAFLRIKIGGVVGARESVHDVAQSVCREVLEDIDQFEYSSDDDFRKWLFLQATRKIVDRHRYLTRARRDAEREVSADQGSEQADLVLDCYATFCTPSRIVSARDELRRVEAAIDRLPDRQGEAVAMSRIMGLDHAAIAERLDCTESAARGLIARGLANLALLLP